MVLLVLVDDVIVVDDVITEYELAGKTTLWQVLRLAMMKMQRSVKLHVINPKAILRTQLLGRIDLDTREWFDGVLTNSAREAVKEPLVNIAILFFILIIFFLLRMLIHGLFVMEILILNGLNHLIQFSMTIGY